MAGDISKKTVAALLVIAIVLSIAGTWLALTVEPINIVRGPSEGEGSGQVSFRIGDEEKSAPSVGGGEVALTKLE